MAETLYIRVYNLLPESVNRLGGQTSAYLDITQPESIRLTKSVETLTDANKLQTAGVLQFSVPSTPTNDAVFLAHLTALTVDNRKYYYDVECRIGGHPLEFNRIAVVGIPKKQGDEWQLEFRRAANHWIELAQDYYINQIDFGTFVFNKDNIVANWENSIYKGEAGQVPYHFPLLDFGGWCDRTEPIPDATIQNVKTLAVEDFRPLISFSHLIKQGFCDIGWTIEGVIFDNDWFSSLWIYALSQKYYEAGSDVSVKTLLTFNLTPTAAENFVFDVLDYGSGQQVEQGTGAGVGYFPGLKNILNIKYRYTFELFADIENSGGDTDQTFNVVEIDQQFNGGPTGEVLSPDVVINFPAGQTKSVSVKISVDLTPGQCAAIRVPNINLTGLNILAGARCTAYPDDQSFYTGQTITISDAIRDDQTLFDWFKAFCHVFRLQAYTDQTTKTITVYPKKKANVYGQTIPGFIRDEEPVIDISQSVVVDSIEVKPIQSTQVRYTEIKFKDSSDSYIDSLNLTTQPHSRKILNGVTLPDGTTTYENLLIEPTLEAQTKGLRGGFFEVYNPPIIPHLWDNTESKRSYDIAPRIFFSFGLVKQKNPSPSNALLQYTGFFFDVIPNIGDTNLVQEFGYATQLRTWDVEPTPAIDGNVVFGTQQEDLFTNFYLSISNEAKGGFDIDLLKMMTMAEFAGVDFRSLYRFYHRGRPYTVPMTKIRDAALATDLPTPVTFFAEPVETECCDLPCGCQFSTCDYYMDFGRFIRQSTVDQMEITTFTVDGISVISTPVSLGVLKIVNISGQPYVTNLVDALNSVGAPYFTFAYSSRLSAVRGARFFTVKRPACTPFEIVVSYNGDEVYKYTDTEQKEQWFAGSWGPLGYTPESYAEPENCVITTEY